MTLTREQWLEERKKGIGGSDAAAVLGLSKWKTPYQLWLEKTGQDDESFDIDSDPMFWGRLLEPVIRQHYSNLTGLSVIVLDSMMWSEEYPFIFADFDGLAVEDSSKILEIKTARSSAGWGELGTDEIPDEYLLQCQHYLIVSKRTNVDIAVLIGGSDFRLYHVKEDKELQAMMLAEYAKFWDKVVQRIPPQTISYADSLARFRQSNGKEIEATPEILRLTQELKDCKKNIDDLTQLSEEIKSKISSYMGENEILTFAEQPLVSWKMSKARISFDTNKLKLDNPAIYQQYAKAGKETRTFLIK